MDALKFDMDDERTARCVRYMDKVAKTEGFSYSLQETHWNRAHLIALYDALKMDGVSNAQLKALSYELAQASRLSVMQGCTHPEPKDMEEYSRLFHDPSPRLDLHDVLYEHPRPKDVVLSYSVDSDDDEMMKLKPGAQLSLFDKVPA